MVLRPGLDAYWLAGDVVSRETDSGREDMLCLATRCTGGHNTPSLSYNDAREGRHWSSTPAWGGCRVLMAQLPGVAALGLDELRSVLVFTQRQWAGRTVCII